MKVRDETVPTRSMMREEARGMLVQYVAGLSGETPHRNRVSGSVMNHARAKYSSTHHEEWLSKINAIPGD
jgi:hypothetical protein